MKAASFAALARALNEAGVRFIVVGGVAVNAHGYGRLTQDVDLVVGLEAANVRHAFRALESLGYRPLVPVSAEGFADPGQRSRWITEKGMTVLNFASDRHRETNVDLFVSEPFDFEAEYRLARIEQAAPDAEVRVIRLPALVAMKRHAGRPQDLADIDELRLLHGTAIDG